MGLTIDYFYSLTPRQFFNIQSGWSTRRNAESLERMVLTRKIMLSNLAPYSKSLTEKSLWPIPEVDNAILQELPEDYLEQINNSIERWQQLDQTAYNDPVKLSLSDLQQLKKPLDN